MESIVYDSFDIKGRVAIDYGATGVVAIFPPVDAIAEPLHGTRVLIIRPDGWMVRAVMGDVKKNGDQGFGVFFEGMSQKDIPVGSRLRWGADFWPAALEEKAAHFAKAYH